MPAKTSTPAKAVPSKRTLRRRAARQRARDVKQTTSRVVSMAQQHVDDYSRGKDMDRKAMSLIAKTVVAPRDMPPLRMPMLSSRATDVKALAHAFTLVSGPVPQGNDCSFSLGGQTLGGAAGLAVLTRDPIAPYFHTKVPNAASANLTTATVGSQFSQAGIHWNCGEEFMDLIGASGGGITGTTRWDFIIPTSVGTLPAGDTLALPVPDRLGDIAPSDVTTVGETFEPVSVDENGRCWFHYGGGVLTVVTDLITNTSALLPLAASCTAKVEIDLERYVDAIDSDFVLSTEITLTNSVPTQITTMNPIDLRAGFYRMRARCVTFTNGSSNTMALGHIRMRVSNLVAKQVTVGIGAGATFSQARYLAHPWNTQFSGAMYMFDQVRVNAAAMLLTNTTPELYKGGEIFVTAVPEREGIGQMTVDGIRNSALKNRTGYRGPLAKGAYTWMEVPDSAMFGFKAAAVYNSVRGRNDPSTATGSGAQKPIYRMTGYGMVHYIYYNATPDGLDTSLTQAAVFQLQCRVDQHLEFISDSQLANLAPAELSVNDLNNACRALSTAPLGTENWAHLSELWSRIKSASMSVLKAGGRAAGAALLSELASGVALLL